MAEAEKSPSVTTKRTKLTVEREGTCHRVEFVDDAQVAGIVYRWAMSRDLVPSDKQAASVTLCMPDLGRGCPYLEVVILDTEKQ